MQKTNYSREWKQAGKTLGIVSVKGGVGKTSFSVNLAAALAGFGKKVLLIDSNLSFPNIGLHLGLTQPRASIHEVMSGKFNAHETVHVHKSGFHVIPGSLKHAQEFDVARLNPLTLRQKINGLKKQYDFIILDSTPSLSKEMLATIHASDELLLITTPDHVTLAATLHAAQVAKQRGRKIAGIVVNRYTNKNFELKQREIEEATGIPVIAAIKEDSKFAEALAHNKPLTLYAKARTSAMQYKKLAARLSDQEFKQSFFSRITSLFGK